MSASRLASLRVERGAPVVRARLGGELDLSNVQDLEQRILDAVENSAFGLVIDLSDVVYLDSACVQMLGDLTRRVGWREQRLAIVAPTGSRAERVLAMVGADALLTVERTVEDAVERVMATDRFGY